MNHDALLDQTDSEPAAAKPRVWSSFQTDIFDFVADSQQNLIIEARAGAAKTTTIIEAMKHASGSSIFLAFNKAIAEDIRRKVFSGDVKTLNALGHSVVMANLPRAKLNARKALDCLKQIMGSGEEFQTFGYTLSRIVGLAKNCAFGIQRTAVAQDFIGLIDNYGFDIPFDRLSSYANLCLKVFYQTAEDTSQFDFDDQLWMPVVHDWQFPQWDNCFVDECQDLSPIQHLMLEKLESNRIIAVGDRHQAIYGFRGALQDSMDVMALKFGMKELPLSISYRCSKAVVEQAQEFCPSIRWREGAPTGSVEWNDSDPARAALWSPYMVLCRTNAPLFAKILQHVREKEPCQVLSSFLDSFQGFIRGFKCGTTKDLMVKLDSWFVKETEAAKKRNQKGKLTGIYDRYDTIKLLAAEFTLVSDMLEMVKSLGQSTRGPIFATIHKSKGLEHPKVYILRPDLLGMFGETPEQQQQESNLHYVAITRAQETLTYGAERK